MYFKNLFKKKYRKLLFTTPSHSQKFCIVNKFRHLYSRDISETDAYNPQEALKKAQHKASDIYGTKQTLFLTNGSTSGIIAGILACTKKDENILLWRDAHRCHHNGVLLAGANPVYYELPIDEKWGIPQKTTVENIEQYLKQYNIKTVVVTSPTYYGVVSDIKKIKEICVKYNAYLIVDEAHGALYPFSDSLPETAIKYADIVVQSLHKTAGGLNPTALLHSNLNFDIQPYLDRITTTSPSYPLLASIEANINYLNSNKGKGKLGELIDEILVLKEGCKNVEFGGDDLTKLLIKKEGISGYELSKKLYDNFDIEDEITNNFSTMLLTGIGTSKKKLRKLFAVLKKI